MLALFLACAPEAPPPAPAPPPRPPDVLLVVLDTVRADATSIGGSTRPTTPNLAALAQQGVTWTDVTTAGTWTWPSHATLFTGLGPWAHGADFVDRSAPGMDLAGMWVSGMDPTVPTLAETFAKAGYTTRLAAANPWLGASFGLARGYQDVYVETDDAKVVTQAAAWMEASTAPTFLTVNLITPHLPYVPRAVPWLSADPKPELQAKLGPFLSPELTLFAIQQGAGFRQSPGFRYMRGELPLDAEGLDLFRRVYDGEVAAVDASLGRLLYAWDKAGHHDGIVVVTSDHGEYIGEHQRFDHGRHVHREVTAVPLVIRAPRKLPPAVKVEVPVSNVGVFGMILDLAGLSRGERPRLPGPKDPGAPILVDARPDGAWAEAVGGAYAQGHRLYREGSLALLLDDDGTTSLFDVVADPGMLHDLSAARPEELSRLKAAATAAFPQRTYTGPVTGNAAAVEALEALGYVAP